MRRHARAWSAACCIVGFAAVLGGATPAVAVACSNEAIRAQQASQLLPECRAWERVSPADKGDTDVYTSPSATFVSPDGGVAIFRADGVGGEEAKSSDMVGDFRSARTPTGWTTRPLGEPVDVDAVRSQPDLRLGYLGYADDLSKGVLIKGDPALTSGTQPGIRNIYRGDLDRRTYDLLSPPILDLSVVDPFTGLFYQPVYADVSTDASHVLFESTQRLTPDAPETVSGAFPTQSGHLYEWFDGETKLVGLVPPPNERSCGPVGPACEPAPQGAVAGRGANTQSYNSAASTVESMSEDGSRVYFTTPDEFFEGGSIMWRGQIFLRREGVATVHVTASRRTEPDPAGTQPAEFAGATPDGRFAFFTSCEKLTDDSTASCSGPAKPDLYRYDDETEALTDLTAAQAGSVDDLSVEMVGTGDDGSIAYYVRKEGTALSSERSIWAVDAGGVSEVTSGLSQEDVSTIGSRLGSLKNGRTTAVSRSGRYLAYSKTVDGHPTLYLYDSREGVSSCVSCLPGGATGKAASIVPPNLNTLSGRDHTIAAIDEQSRWLLFETAGALVQRDTNGRTDVYRYDIGDRSVSLISDGRSAEDAHVAGMTPDGTSIFFTTTARLVAGDRDGFVDLYVARMDGGFPEPTSATPCVADACRSAVGLPPQSPGLGSQGFSSPGNPKRHRGNRARLKKRKPGIEKVTRPSAAALSGLVAGRTLRLRVNVTGAGRVVATGVATVGGRDRRVLFGSARSSAAGRAGVPLKLSASARREVRRLGSVPVSLTVRFRDSRPQTIQINLKNVEGGAR